jgi:hypothetical protein
MQVGARRCLVCDCEGSMRLDGAGLARALGGVEAAPVVHHQLCGAQLDRYREALGAGGPLLVACTQEAPLFGEVAGERGGRRSRSRTCASARAGRRRVLPPCRRSRRCWPRLPPRPRCRRRRR